MSEHVIHPRWQAWVAENLARDAEPDTIVATLVENDVPADRARALVDGLATSPALAVARKLSRRAAALEQIVRLRAEHRRIDPAIARGPLPSVHEFWARHWVGGVPLVVTDLVTRWPAFTRWSLDDLAARFGDVTIEACVGRSTVARPDADWAPLAQQMSVRDLVARLRDATSNDVYVIAKNAAIERSGLRPLVDDIVLPPAYFGPKLDPSRTGLWIGGAGTHTPLHHDGDDAFFCQVVGTKRIRLAPPESMWLLERSRGVYCRWDPTTEDALHQAPEPLAEVVLAPGEALFIPAGWWHQVDALDVSMSVSLRALAWPNDFSWYRPGTTLAGRAR